jgi:hypothetical protein
MTMADEISELTPEQQELHDRLRDEYMEHGWSSEPSDRPAAEQAMIDIYSSLGKEPPKFVWFDSPHQALDTIYESTGQREDLSGFDGGMDAPWVLFYKFLCHIIPNSDDLLDDTVRLQLDAYDRLVRSSGPCWPYQNYCLMSERPVRAERDDNQLLHSDDGPALEYRDGTKIYAINGVQFEDQELGEIAVERPWELTLQMIEDQDSEDIRTILQQRWCYEELDGAGDRVGFGYGRYLEEIGARQIHEDVYQAYGDTVLMRALLETEDGRRFLMCTDSSTDRVYYLRVDDQSQTCEQAHMSINGGISDGDIVVSA